MIFTVLVSKCFSFSFQQDARYRQFEADIIMSGIGLVE